jgi:acetylornithine deacetylase/succinyl-diaminopimelate desuccinylase family protein
MLTVEPVAEAHVLDALDALDAEMVETLSALVRLPTVTPKYPGLNYSETVGGEGAANHFLSQRFVDAGCRIDLWEEEAGRANLVGVVNGTGGGRSLILNGHVDTVPPGDHADWRWNDPFSGRVDDGRLYGLGAADQKAGLVAMLFAARALKSAGVSLHGDLILESVVGEETMDHDVGVSATVRRGYRADAGIVTEPTSYAHLLSVAPVSGGGLAFTLTCEGKATHPGARMELIRAGGRGTESGANAIEKGVYLVQMLQSLEQQWGISKRYPLFRPGFFTIHPGVIVGGPPGPPVPFIVSTYCRVEYVVWYPPNQTAEQIMAEIQAYVHKAAALDPWLAEHPPKLHMWHDWPPFEVNASNPFKETLRAAHQAAAIDATFAEGGHIEAFGAVCDATYLNRAGIPTVVYGPGNLSQCHARNEWVAVDELRQAARTYALAAMRWCGF